MIFEPLGVDRYEKIIKTTSVAALMVSMAACASNTTNSTAQANNAQPTAQAQVTTNTNGYIQVGADTTQITAADIDAAQQAWGSGLKNIGSVYRSGGDYKQTAKDFLQTMYAFNQNDGTILFKPTLASKKPFRSDMESALSYFIGGEISEDEGFAIKPWKSITFNNDQIFIHGDIAVAMGQYTFNYDNQSDVLVEYTFVYKKVGNHLKILTQHSSVPFSAK